MEQDDRIEARIQLPTCRIVTIAEMCAMGAALANAQVRFVARLASLDCSHSSALFDDEGATILIDTSQLAVEQQPARIGSLYSIMGEAGMYAEPTTGSHLRIRARLVRPVDGLNLAVWKEALEVKKQYDARVVGAPT